MSVSDKHAPRSARDGAARRWAAHATARAAACAARGPPSRTSVRKLVLRKQEMHTVSTSLNAARCGRSTAELGTDRASSPKSFRVRFVLLLAFICDSMAHGHTATATHIATSRRSKQAAAGEAIPKWALITGASSGIGRELAIQAAETGYSVIITARNHANLDALALQIRRDHDVLVKVVPCDLSHQHASFKLDRATAGLDVRLLVLNAGYAYFGRFETQSAAAAAQMLSVNVGAAVSLSQVFVPRLLDGRDGYVLIVGSASAAVVGVPNVTLYAATKVSSRDLIPPMYICTTAPCVARALTSRMLSHVQRLHHFARESTEILLSRRRRFFAPSPPACALSCAGAASA
eukprot:6209334-Pleurochrysis_carterae.AAC.1